MSSLLFFCSVKYELGWNFEKKIIEQSLLLLAKKIFSFVDGDEQRTKNFKERYWESISIFKKKKKKNWDRREEKKQKEREHKTISHENLFLSSAAKKAKEPNSNGLYTRSTNRGITQVPEQLALNLDHDMDDDDDIDHDQQQPLSPTVTNASDEQNDLNLLITDDDEQQQNQTQSMINSIHQRKRMAPLTSHRRPPPSSSSSGMSSTMNEKSDLLSVRTHLEKGKMKLQMIVKKNFVSWI